MWFPAGTTAATTAANRIINVWANFQEARRNGSNGLVRRGGERVQATIDAPIPLEGAQTTGYERFNLAAQTLMHLGELEVDEEV